MWSSDYMIFVLIGSILVLPFFAVLYFIDEWIDASLQDDSNDELNNNQDDNSNR